VTEVTREQFFAALTADHRDIMPTVVSKPPYESIWKTREGDIFGKSIGCGKREIYYMRSPHSERVAP
jgi:TorA maturation chaperone TorD